MNLLNRLTIKNLKLNKKRTIVTCIGIMLSVALITALATLYTSAIQSLIDFEIKRDGDYHVAFEDVPEDEMNVLINNRKIEKLYTTKNIGYARLEESKNEYKPYAFIQAMTKEAMNNLPIRITEGRLPENENEILIPTHLETNGRIDLKVGDKIKLDVGTRLIEGKEANQHNTYSKDIPEEIVNTETKEYTVVGITTRMGIEDYSAPGYTFVTYIDENKLAGNLNVYVRYTKQAEKDYLRTTANILGVDEDIYYNYMTDEVFVTVEDYAKEMEKAKFDVGETNSYLIRLETNPLEDGSITGLSTVAGIVCAIIVFTSVFCIKNSFDISITEKIKQYGMLRSIGATKKQIRRNVFWEATILGIIGIPLGILLGFIAAFILVLVSNHFLNNMAIEQINLVFQFSWLAVLGSVILGIITIYFSSFKSAIKASKISPIDSIRNSGEITIKAKKLRSPKIIKKLFGMGGEISYKNLKRNKKKYRTTVVSMAVSVLVFISLFSFMEIAFRTVRKEIEVKDYNLDVYCNVKHNEDIKDKFEKIENLDDVKMSSITAYRTIYAYSEKAKYSKEYLEHIEYYGSIKMEDENGQIRDVDSIQVYRIGDKAFKDYIKKLGLNYEEVKDKGILLNTVTVVYANKDKYIGMQVEKYDCKKGDVFTFFDEIQVDENNKQVKNYDIQIACVTDKLPFGITQTGTNNARIILSDEYYNQLFPDDYESMKIDSSNPDKTQDEIDEILEGEDYQVHNINEEVKQMESLYMLIGIFLYGFIIVISLIGITNIFNTITTNMNLRRQEFAMLKSIGMTNKEFKRMINLETIFMGTKSLVYGILIGLGLSGLIYKALGESNGLKYSLPITAIVISIAVIFLLITCIMKYSMNKINKQNTIETIRNENI